MSSVPRIHPTGVLLAALFLTVFGFLWFGVLFKEFQMVSHGYTAADYEGNNPLWYAGGAIISVVIALGLAMVVRLGGQAGSGAGFKAGVRAVLGFGLPLVAYPFVFSPHHEFALFMAGIAHIIIGWTLGAMIIGRFTEPADQERKHLVTV